MNGSYKVHALPVLSLFMLHTQALCTWRSCIYTRMYDVVHSHDACIDTFPLRVAASKTKNGKLLQVAELQQKQTLELKQVQKRVQTAVATKDDTIAALREQLNRMAQQLRSTEAVLEQQQNEFCQA